MKRIFILILTILVEGFTISFAQAPANYQVKGQIKDARTGETMPLVNVALLRPSDSVFMRGATSDMTGSYAIRDVAAGQYQACGCSILPGRWITSSSTIPALCSSCRFPARSLQDLSR
ncbi:MAG: carboxypeptidase-like regulatory domain-containing protein [Bacteroidales bacterium]|nr:carboxypeptidase-like regulatory domain-containing protein [Bacteroidales bacterium]